MIQEQHPAVWKKVNEDELEGSTEFEIKVFKDHYTSQGTAEQMNEIRLALKNGLKQQESVVQVRGLKGGIAKLRMQFE